MAGPRLDSPWPHPLHAGGQSQAKGLDPAVLFFSVKILQISLDGLTVACCYSPLVDLVPRPDT